MNELEYDRWKLSSGYPENKYVGDCEHCGGELFSSHPYIKTNIGDLHEDCFDEFVSRFLNVFYVEHGDERFW